MQIPSSPSLQFGAVRLLEQKAIHENPYILYATAQVQLTGPDIDRFGVALSNKQETKVWKWKRFLPFRDTEQVTGTFHGSHMGLPGEDYDAEIESIRTGNCSDLESLDLTWPTHGLIMRLKDNLNPDVFRGLFKWLYIDCYQYTGLKSPLTKD